MKQSGNGAAAYARLAPVVPTGYIIGVLTRETNGMGGTSQEKTSE